MTPSAISKKEKRLQKVLVRIQKDKKLAAKLEMEIRDAKYLNYFDELTSEPIDWDRMCWPSRSSGGNTREILKCIVCLSPINPHPYWSGSVIGNGWNNPRVQVHLACIPPHIIERETKTTFTRRE